MKKKKILHMMDLADEKYVTEAAPRSCEKRINWRRFALVAACLCLVLTGANLWLFLPYSTTPPDVSAYRDSDYYSLIEKLNIYTYEPPAYKNNFDKLTGTIEDTFLAGSGMGGAMAPGAPSNDSTNSEGNSGTGKYEEVTDNQVAGVIEGDLFKRSDKYIYSALSHNSVRVYSIAGAESELMVSYPLSSQSGQNLAMYLTGDCKTLILIRSCPATKTEGQGTVIHAFAVDGHTLVEQSTVTLSGIYQSSRMVDGELLVFTKHTVHKNRIDFHDESTYLPQIKTKNGTACIAADQIYAPDVISNLNYTVIYKFDGKTLGEKDSAAFLSYSDIFYVNKTHIYATRRYTETTDTKSWRTNEVKTEIVCISYTGEEIARVGSVTLDGYLHDQYSMDEYNGILRVVTSTDKDSWQTGPWNGSFNDLPAELQDERSANLYCVDIATWEIAAEVIGFAPQGEQVESVRFDGDSAYVCTAVVVTMTDPVFFFDLGDLDSITYKDTGMIEGYSSSLVNFAPGYLLGIGQGDWNTLKIEVYKETDTGVVSVIQYEMQVSSFTTDYKAYYIDRENGLIGFAIRAYPYADEHGYGADVQRYIVLQFEDEQLHKVLDIAFTNNPDYTRGVYIDDHFYMISGSDFAVHTLGDPTFIPKEKNPVKVHVTSLPEQYDYTFAGASAEAIGKYLQDLRLTSGFSENPDQYVGMAWIITLEYGDGTQITLSHFANMFIRRTDSPIWYKMNYEDASYFGRLINELQPVRS